MARKAFFAIWNRRTDLGLLPNTINLATGVSRVSLIGVTDDEWVGFSYGSSPRSPVLALALIVFMNMR